MKKKHIFSGLLMVTIAALAFTACGKKKTNPTTTKDNTTTVAPEPDVEEKTKNYFAKEVNGIMAFEVRKENNEIQYLNVFSYEMEGMPITIKPIIENGKITKVKVGSFVSQAYLIQTIELSDKGIDLLTELSYHDIDDDAENYKVFVKSDNGKLVLYNRYMQASIDNEGNVTTTDFDSSKTISSLGEITMSYNNGSYKLSAGDHSVEVSTDPSNMVLTISEYNNYLKKFVAGQKYVINLTAEKPYAKIYQNIDMASISYGDDIFYEGKLVEMGSITVTLDNNGNTTECEMVQSMYGMERKAKRYFTYNDKNQLATYYYDDESTPNKKYIRKYSYDENNRIASYEYGTSISDVYSQNQKYEFEYTNYGYQYIVSKEENGNKTQYQFTYDTDDFLSMTKYLIHDGTKYNDVYDTTYEYDNNNLLTVEKTDYYESDRNNEKYEYIYENSVLKTKKHYKNYLKTSPDEYEEYLYSSETYTSGKESDLYYFTSTTIYYGTDGNTSYTRTETVQYLDENYINIKTDSDVTLYSDLSTKYDIETYTYNDKGLLTSIVNEDKVDKSSDTIKTYTKTYTYDASGIIQTVSEIQMVGNVKSNDTLKTYNTNGRIIEDLDNMANEKDVYTYDSDMNLTKKESQEFVNNVYRPTSAMIYEPGNAMIPMGMIQYKYDNTTKKLTDIIEMYYDSAADAMSSTNYSKTVAKSFASDGETLLQVLTKYYYTNETHRIKENNQIVYLSDGETIAEENITIYYDDNSSTKKEESTKQYNITTTKYEGTKTTYKADGTPDKEYTWNDTTKSWDEN